MATITIFIALPELLRCLAEVIRSRKQLSKLRLVSKEFHAAATPFLFRDFHIQLSSAVSLHETSGHLRHVRKLSVTPGWYMNTEDQNERIQQMVTRMPRLESFDCRDIPLSTQTLQILHDSCPRITAIHIAFPRAMETNARWALNQIKDGVAIYPSIPVYPGLGRGEIPETYRNPDLTMFSRLEELTLEWLYQDPDWWKAQAVQLLRGSPGLRRLHLSLSPDSIHYWPPQTYHGFFDSLCNAYGATGALPLRLESLKCGVAVYPSNVMTLKKLTDLSHLEEVHIANGTGRPVTFHITVPVQGPSDVAYDAFGPAHSPNLRRFTTDVYRKDVEEFFGTMDDPDFTRHLAISCQNQHGHQSELAALLQPNPAYPRLPLRFRMLDIELEREPLPGQDDEEEMAPIEEILDLITNDGGALEGLMVRLPEDLDNEYGMEHLDLLESALSKLVNLTQLAIAVGNFVYIRREEFTKEMFLGAAQRLAAAAPRLRYIRICCQHYRIWRDNEGIITLEELEDREIDDVELFSHSIYLPIIRGSV